jgi:c(7)-type cytochrome triheme protein
LPVQRQLRLIRPIELRLRTRSGLALWLALICSLAAASLSGCSAEFQDKILTTFFDDVKAPPPKRKLRQDFVRENDQLKAELAEAKRLLAEKDGKGEKEIPPGEKAKSWPELVRLLPKGAGNTPDWTAAIKAKIIAPRPGSDPKDPEQAPLDLDLELATSPNKAYTAVFPHNTHTQWLSCANCHPSIYPLKREGDPEVITMAKINAGESCGVCHGKVAFPTTACVKCHPAAGDGKSQKPKGPESENQG